MEDNTCDSIERFLNIYGEKKEKEHLFTDEEYQQIILSFLNSRGDEGADEEEIIQIVHWCEEIQVSKIMIDLVLKGFVNLTLIDGKPCVELSEEGLALKESW